MISDTRIRRIVSILIVSLFTAGAVLGDAVSYAYAAEESGAGTKAVSEVPETPEAGSSEEGQQEEAAAAEEPEEPAATEEPAEAEEPEEPAVTQTPEGPAVTQEPEEPAAPEEPAKPAVPEDIVDTAKAGPAIVYWKRKSQTEMILQWKAVSGVDGYEIQCDTATGFSSPALVRINITNGTYHGRTVTGLAANTFYYVRIRSYRKLPEGNREFSAWTLYNLAGKNFTTKLTVLRKGGRAIDWHTYLPKKYRTVYRVLQGTTTDGTYNYYFFEPPSGNKCIILKVNARTNAKVRVSAPLVLDHANDAAYNPRTKKLYVVHWDGHPYRISVVDPTTLKVVSYKDIKPGASVPGLNATTVKSITGYAGITYNSVRRQFALRVSGGSNLLLLDENLKPVRFVKASKTLAERPQSLDSDADHIYSCLDRSGSYNVIAVYDWDGHYLYQVRVPSKFEIQGIFQRGGAVYANFYDGHYNVKYRIRKVRWKKVRGKWKYRYARVAYKQYVRRSYTYRLSGI